MLRRLLPALLSLTCCAAAWALDYRSVAVPAAVLYDAPSQKAKKLYLIKEQTPVEVVVRLDGWLKVRDVEGTLAWIDAAQVSERRTVIVTATPGELRAQEQTDAPVLARFDKWVVLEFLGPGATGWVNVRHRDGATGVIRTNQVWGL